MKTYAKLITPFLIIFLGLFFSFKPNEKSNEPIIVQHTTLEPNNYENVQNKIINIKYEDLKINTSQKNKETIYPLPYMKWDKGNIDDYYFTYYPHIKKAAEKYNINARALAEIIMLESNNGKSKLSSVYNNNSGLKIKRGKYLREPFKGYLKKVGYKIVKHKDDDFDKNGKLLYSDFYHFRTRLDGIYAAAAFIRSRINYPINEGWENANLGKYSEDKEHSIKMFLSNIQKTGYASDKNYSKKLINNYNERKERYQKNIRF